MRSLVVRLIVKIDAVSTHGESNGEIRVSDQEGQSEPKAVFCSTLLGEEQQHVERHEHGVDHQRDRHDCAPAPSQARHREKQA